MAKTYTVEDDKGRQITFEWDGDGDPTDADYEEVFAAADVPPSARFEGPDFLRRQGDTLPEKDDPFAGYADPEYAAKYFNIVDNYVRPIAKGTAGAVASVASVPLLAANPALGLPAAAMGTGAAMTGVDSAIDLASGRPEGVREQADEFLINSAYSLGAPAMRGTTALRQFGANVVEGALSNAMGGNVERAATGQSGDFGTELYRTATDAATGGATAGVMTGAAPTAAATARGAKAAAKAAAHPKQTAAKLKVRYKNSQKDGGTRLTVASLTPDGEIAIRRNQNLADALELADAIGGGWHAGLGEMTGDPRALSNQRKMQMQDGDAAAARHELELNNIKAEEADLARNGLKMQPGDIEAARAGIEKRREQIARQAADAADRLEAAATQLEGAEKVEAGAVLRERAEEIRATLKAEATRLYNKVDRTHELDDVTADFWYGLMTGRRATIDEAYVDPKSAPIATLDRVSKALEADPQGNVPTGTEVRVTVDGKSVTGKITKFHPPKGESNTKTGIYEVQTSDGPVRAKPSDVRLVPKVKTGADAPPEYVAVAEIKKGDKIEHVRYGKLTAHADGSKAGRDTGASATFVNEKGDLITLDTDDMRFAWREGQPKPDKYKANSGWLSRYDSVEYGDHLVHPEKGPGVVIAKHPATKERRSSQVEVKWQDGSTESITDLRFRSEGISFDRRISTEDFTAPPRYDNLDPGAKITHPGFDGEGTVKTKDENGRAVQVDFDGETITLTRDEIAKAKFAGDEPIIKGRKDETVVAEEAPTPPKRSEPVTFGDLMDFRSQITTKIREARAAGKFDLANRLGDVLGDVEQVIGKAGDNPNGAEAVKALREANKFWRDTYVPRVRQGATGKVLKNDRTGRARVEDVAVGKQYFKPGDKGIQAAKDFNTTYGDDADARQAIEDHAVREMLDFARNKETGQISPSRVRIWQGNHRKAIEGLGLGKKLSSLEHAMKAAEAAKGQQAAFEKTQFVKALDADPEHTFERAFGGKNASSPKRAMQELVDMMKGDKAALTGLKRSFADWLVNKSRGSAEDPLSNKRRETLKKAQDAWDQYGEAMKVLYSKGELDAMMRHRAAVGIKARIHQPTSGVAGSQTAELQQDVTKAALAALPWHLKLVAKGMMGSWQDGVRRFAIDALYDPRLARKLVDIDALAKKDPKAAEQMLKDEVKQAGTFAPEERRIFNEFRAGVEKIRDPEMAAEIVKKAQEARATGNLSPEEHTVLLDKILRTDPKTGLGNSLAYELDDEVLAMPHQYETDIDGFKYINDKYGHIFGDEVLRKKGDAFKTAGIKTFRYGGDEYVGGTDNPMLIEKAREAFRNTVFIATTSDGRRIKITGLDFGYGTGKNKEAADADLTAKKVKRREGRVEVEFMSAEGKATRGAKPQGLIETDVPGGE